jgi:uncharacterized protein
LTGREPAWRLFAHEFQASVQEESSGGERPVRHVLSPLGARMNRVLLVGTLGVPEPVGKDPAAPFLRSRLSDPTGSFNVTAGGFQPRALSAFQSIQSPQRSLVVGKAHLFSGRDGVAYGSVRAEGLRAISEEEYRADLTEALRQTLARLDLIEDVRGGRGPESAPDAARAGIAPLWWTGATRAAARYPTVDLAPFRAPLAAVLREIAGPAPLPPVPNPPTTVRVTRTMPPEPAVAPSAAERAQEASFLDIVDDLSERSADGYADLKEALGLAERSGLAGDRAEELLNRLEETGVLEEPLVGKLRRA